MTSLKIVSLREVKKKRGFDPNEPHVANVDVREHRIVARTPGTLPHLRVRNGPVSIRSPHPERSPRPGTS